MLFESPRAVQHNSQNLTAILLNPLPGSVGRFRLGTARWPPRGAGSSAVTSCGQTWTMVLFPPVISCFHPILWLAGRGNILFTPSWSLLYRRLSDCFVRQLNVLWCQKTSPIYFIFKLSVWPGALHTLGFLIGLNFQINLYSRNDIP